MSRSSHTRFHPYAQNGPGPNKARRSGPPPSLPSSVDLVAANDPEYDDVVQPQLPVGDRDSERAFRHAQTFAPVPQRGLSDSAVEELEQWLQNTMRMKTVDIPRWKVNSAVPVATNFKIYMESCMLTTALQFRPKEFVSPSVIAQRCVSGCA